MGILDSFEKGLERAVNGAFAKTFRSGLQPVEISSALKRELDTTAAVVSRDRILAANTFAVHLSPTDFERMSKMGGALVDELVAIVKKYGRAQGYTFAGAVSVTLRPDPGLSEGIMRVDTEDPQTDVVWLPALDIAGQRYPLARARTVIGRGSDADITIADPGTSRKHVEILWDGKRAQVHDLGSTNGSELNGQRVTQALLEDGSVIQIGRTQITYRLLAQSAPKPAENNNDGFWGNPV
ncbi:FhaA domain-containing protein [Mycetocola saprophilus]|uniref:FhaA domain-containing protein n=1 Tax=Mycetocola saprophilus TaxID=76636 RepID=UPI003BF0AFA4